MSFFQKNTTFYFILSIGILEDCNTISSIAHNVPAVYDGLAARIKKCVAFLGPTNCGGGFAWE
jgi:hypothetical protein